MPTFVWEGRTAQGRVIKGDNLEAPSMEAALARLREQRIRPIPNRVREKGKGLEKELSIPGFGAKVTTKDLSLATRQLATMIDAGLPIVQCLDILAQQSENKLLRNTIGTIRKDVEQGCTLADALRKHPKVFDDLYVNMVEAGEAGGILNTILNRIAVFIEKANRLKKKVKGAMIYPCAIVFVAVVVVSVLMIWVIPVFAELLLVAGVIGIIMAISFYYKTPQGHMNIDRLLLRMPVIGDLLRKVAIARFSQNMALLLSSGVPILDGLAITGKTAGNKVVEKAILESRISISQGKTVAEPLRDSKIFPPLVCQMVAIGESTGGLDAMLKKVAELYEEEVDDAVNNLTAMMEPMIMVVLGVILGGLVVAMYLPIFQMGDLVGG